MAGAIRAEPVPRSGAELAAWVRDARQSTLALIADLSDDQLIGPKLAIVNPLLWEIGHVAWFQEQWVLRHASGEPPIRPDGDALWDSARVAHDTRWDLPLPPREETLRYVLAVRDRVVELLEKGDPEPRLRYFVLLTVFHEDMHAEAFSYTRQTLAYPPPRLLVPAEAHRGEPREGARAEGDVHVPGGSFLLGASREEPFVFDNEKWAHRREVRPFAIGRTPVTQGEFLAFVEEGGYARPELWSEEGWRWRQERDAAAPWYWRRDGGGRWMRRRYDAWIPLDPDLPVVHVCFFEAEAYCRFARRRLPTELEWEVAAAAEPSPGGDALGATKRRFPWGEAPPRSELAHLDGRGGDVASVHACGSGDSAFGCRQMLGNVWEWTASDFGPYPGFAADPYKEYSEPWFHTRKVLRGGAWATRGRLLRNTWRNFFEPWRRDVWAGFRTCALVS